MQRKTRTFSPGDRVAIEISFACEGSGEIESVEAVFVREGSGEEILFLGDCRKESSGEDERAVYTARLEAKVDPGATPGDYHCAASLSATGLMTTGTSRARRGWTSLSAWSEPHTAWKLR